MCFLLFLQNYTSRYHFHIILFRSSDMDLFFDRTTDAAISDFTLSVVGNGHYDLLVKLHLDVLYYCGDWILREDVELLMSK